MTRWHQKTVAALTAWWQRWQSQPRGSATWREVCAEYWTASFPGDNDERAELAVDVHALAMLGIAADDSVQQGPWEAFLREAVLLSGPAAGCLQLAWG